MGHTIAVAYHGRDDLNASARDSRIEYLPLPSMYPGPGWAVESLATTRAMERHIKTYRPDVVHGSFRVGTFDLRLPTVCARLDIPLVVTFHVSFARGMSTAAVSSAASYSFYRKALNSCAAIAAFGPLQRRWLKRLSGVDQDRVYEIPHGVNHIRFCPGHSDWREGIEESFIVGYVGRFAPEKNLEALCQGFLQAGVKDARLVLMGQGPSSGKLRRKFNGHESISLLDPITDRARVADLMRGLDLFVLPSHIEGLSLSMLEAMASGVVPVATDVGEHHSLVDGCGVILNPARATEGVRRILIELATHPDRRRSLAAAARARARRRGWDRTTSEILDLYRKVI